MSGPRHWKDGARLRFSVRSGDTTCHELLTCLLNRARYSQCNLDPKVPAKPDGSIAYYLKDKYTEPSLIVTIDVYEALDIVCIWTPNFKGTRGFAFRMTNRDKLLLSGFFTSLPEPDEAKQADP